MWSRAWVAVARLLINAGEIGQPNIGDQAGYMTVVVGGIVATEGSGQE